MQNRYFIALIPLSVSLRFINLEAVYKKRKHDLYEYINFVAYEFVPFHLHLLIRLKIISFLNGILMQKI